MADFVDPTYVVGGYFLSDTLDVQLAARLGPLGSARRQRRYAGSDVPVWCDITDRQTGDAITYASELSGMYWPPDADPGDADGQPLTVEQASPGTLIAVVPRVVPGTYAVQFRIGLPIIQVGGVTFDVASDTTGQLLVGAVIPWSSIQAAAAAMGASAGAAEARVVGGTAGASAGAAAGLAVITGAAALPATATLAGLAIPGAQAGSAVHITGETILAAAGEAGSDVAQGIAEAAAIAAVAALGPAGVASLLGLPIYDFSDPRNSALLTF